MIDAAIEALGDGALLIRLGDRIDVALNARAVALSDALRRLALPGVHDIAPAYASVGVHYDPAAWHDQTDGRCAFERLAQRLREWLASESETTSRASAADDIIEIPVCYGGESGPDLDEVARHARLSPDEVIARHAGAEYRVAMLGFAPGFPYLLGLDPALQMPRRANPRTRVPAGSVAIGGAQTGIYPRELPGGWHLIGRTPLALFDLDLATPALLRAGARVRFRAIDAGQFKAFAR